MSDIRAFVGHSFTEDDAHVVNCFLKYFEQLAKLNAGFSWQHAENAEPKQLTEKVMQLISDKNVFIAICTKKEAALSPASTLSIWLQPEYLKIKRQSVTWKTSDWIIQEIGLAIGRGLDLILLIENGVRPPGGLQGNVEYITFDRESPEKSFGKITEMITALSPKASSISIASPDTSSVSSAEREPEPSDDDWNIPKPEWKRSNYERAMMRAVFFKDTQAIASLDQAYLKTEHAVHQENRDSWAAFRECAVLLFGKGGSLATLKKSAEEHPKNSLVLSYLARGFNHHEKYREAADTFEAAAREAASADERFRLLGRAAAINAKAQDSISASRLVNEMKFMAASSKEEMQLLQVLHEIAQTMKAVDMELAIMERIVDIDPDNIELKYTLAHKHSERGNKDLALMHYLGIPSNERTAATWNNLGVAFHSASLRGKSVNAYRQSEEMGETLAMSNLAHLLIRAGFLREAQEQCDKALKIEDYDKNVIGALERLKEQPEEEDKKESEVLDKAKPKSAFYKKFGRAASLADANNIDGQWKGPQCAFEVKVVDGEFIAVGSFEKPREGLLFGMGGLMRSASTQRMIIHKIEYRGFVWGRTITARITHDTGDDDVGAGATALASTGSDESALMILSETGNELSVMEGMERNNQTTYSLTRVVTIGG